MKILRHTNKDLPYTLGPSFLIVVLLLFYTRAEETLYYWDFGDYQYTLSGLQGSMLNPAYGYFASIFEIQKSEYPLNWALLFPFIPHGYFSHRFFFTSYLGVFGLIPWAYAAKIICNKILTTNKWGNIAFITLLFSPGPWMLVLRGWPDVIALGLIWLGFAVAFKPTHSSNYWLGIFLIAFGAIMRKTTILLALTLILFLVFYLLSNRRKDKSLLSSRKSMVLMLFGIILTVFLTPGTYLTIFNRNNSQFYRPFNISWLEYFNNLFSVNGSIQVLGAALLPFLLIVLKKMQTTIDIQWKIIFMIFLIPAIHIILWMRLLAQATDHHMVQWVPIYFSISIGVLIVIIHQTNLVKNIRVKTTISILIVIVNFSVFFITIHATVTPFGNPQYSFERPIARSLAPIKRPDYDALVSLGYTLKNLSLKNPATLAILNESHEMNSGIVQALKRKYDISNLDYSTIGALDYRDDLGLNQLLNANLFLVPKEMIVLIPGFQTNLSIMANDIRLYAEKHPELFTPISTYRFGAPYSANSWWNNQYIKSSSTFTLYRLNKALTAQQKIQLSQTIANNILRGSHYAGSLILAIAPNSGVGPSAASGDKVEFSIRNSEFSGLLVKSKSITVNSSCNFKLQSSSGKLINGNIGKNKFDQGASPQEYIVIKNSSMPTSKLCNYEISPS
jgi:hypothetical protein